MDVNEDESQLLQILFSELNSYYANNLTIRDLKTYIRNIDVEFQKVSSATVINPLIFLLFGLYKYLNMPVQSYHGKFGIAPGQLGHRFLCTLMSKNYNTQSEYEHLSATGFTVLLTNDDEFMLPKQLSGVYELRHLIPSPAESTSVAILSDRYAKILDLPQFSS